MKTSLEDGEEPLLVKEGPLAKTVKSNVKRRKTAMYIELFTALLSAVTNFFPKRK